MEKALCVGSWKRLFESVHEVNVFQDFLHSKKTSFHIHTPKKATLERHTLIAAIIIKLFTCFHFPLPHPAPPLSPGHDTVHCKITCITQSFLRPCQHTDNAFHNEPTATTESWLVVQILKYVSKLRPHSCGQITLQREVVTVAMVPVGIRAL